MKFLTIKLGAGVGTPIGAKGNYFRILSGTSDFRVSFNLSNGREYSTNWKVGIGARLDQAFNSLTVESDIDQTVEIAYGFGSIDDSRLTGDVDINGILSVVNAGGSSYDDPNVTLVAATAAAVLSANTNRLKATIQPDVDIYIGKDATVTNADGILIKAGGSVEVDNTAALYGYSVAGGLVRVLEDLK